MRRSSWILPLRTLAAAVMLGVLLRRTHVSSLVPQWDTRAVLWLSGALAVTLFGIVLSTLRWRQVLAALGLRARVRTLFSYYLAGLFVGNFLPSTIGGDVLRVSRLSAVNGDRPDTFASVVLERLTGWLVLPLLTLAAMALNPGLSRLGTASAVALALAGGTLVLLVGVLLAAASPRIGGRLAGSAGWQRFIGAVHLGLGRFRHHPGV
ncbi:MAG: flippase-like domain-containing protein, partial [Acidimicrobiia bacterium]|nr:flippase-like domain-containing protein [Acidimicrobiia bacterium]